MSIFRLNSISYPQTLSEKSEKAWVENAVVYENKDKEHDIFQDKKFYENIITIYELTYNASLFIKNKKAFCTFALKVQQKNKHTINYRQISKVSDIIDSVLKKSNAIFAQTALDVFSGYIPSANKKQCIKYAEKIKEKIETCTGHTVLIGIAEYPCLDYSRKETLNNAFKSLNHAALSEPGSIISFDAVTLNISGDNLYQQKDKKHAISEYIKALLLDPVNTNIINSLGVCYAETDNYKKAMLEFETAIFLEPNNPMFLYNIALIYKLKGDIKKSVSYLKKAYQTDNNHFETSLQLGIYYLHQQNHEKGKKLLENCVKINPDAAVAFRYLGELYLELNMIEKGIWAFKNCIKKNPFDAFSLSALGFLYEISGENLEIAKTLAKYGVDMVPENGLYRYRLGRIYFKEQKFKKAMTEFKKALKNGHDSTIFYMKRCPTDRNHESFNFRCGI